MSREVISADGTRIAVHESGNPDGTLLVAVHGYPDNHTVWDGVAEELGERYRVVRYDVRGAGASGKPVVRAAYRMERLTEDLLAVLDAVSPDAPVHLVAHDWGSIQCWGAVQDPRTAGRIAGYTSISGPCLDYVAHWMRDRSHPGASLRQALHSWYIAAFQIPWLPERVVRLPAVERGIERAELRGSGGRLRRPVQRSEADKVNGIALYRANIPRILARPDPRPVDVPVQVLAPIEDAYVSVPLATQTAVGFVERLTVHRIDGGHWTLSESPERVARYVDEFVSGLGQTPTPTAAAPESAESG